MKIELTTGEKIVFEEFPLREQNLRKINIDWDGEDGEGLWAYFSDEAIKQYENDNYTDGSTVIVLANSPLAFYPHNFWGAFLPVKFRGDNRPYCNLSELSGTPLFHSITKDKKEP